jgi:membrane-associated phospholipid phosphatase
MSRVMPFRAPYGFFGLNGHISPTFWLHVAILLYFFWRLAGTTCLCLALLSLVACSSFGARTRHAVSAAARDPWTWAPLAGAAVIAGTHNDKRISDWAKTETPVFGSREAAVDASNRFRSYASSTTWAIFLASPQQGQGNWFMEKGMNASGNLMGLALARSATGVLKHTVERERPNGNPVHDSFPSAHSTDAFAHAALARNYNDDLHSNGPLGEGMQWASNGFAMATAWGRVEGGAHYPTDVLVGAAVANFTTRFIMRMSSSNANSSWRVRTRTDENGKLIIQFERSL